MLETGQEIIYPKYGRMKVIASADIFAKGEDAVIFCLEPWAYSSWNDPNWVCVFGKRDGSEFWGGIYGTRFWALEKFGERVTERVKSQR